MGNFRRIYPAAVPPVQAKYEWLLQGSARMFATSMKAKAHNTIGRIQVGFYINMMNIKEITYQRNHIQVLVIPYIHQCDIRCDFVY